MERMSAIELAIENEKTEMEFYRNEARRSRNSLAQTMFTSLAREEEQHIRRLRTLHQKLSSSGSWPPDVPIEVDGTNIREILAGLAHKQGSAENHDQDDQQALERAADFEARGAEFYAEIARKCPNSMEKNFFSLLSGIEREHHLSLTESLAYLRDPQTWMLEHERAGLDGA